MQFIPFNKKQRDDTLIFLNRTIKNDKWVCDNAAINKFNQLMISFKSPGGEFGRTYGFKLEEMK